METETTRQRGKRPGLESWMMKILQQIAEITRWTVIILAVAGIIAELLLRFLEWQRKKVTATRKQAREDFEYREKYGLKPNEFRTLLDDAVQREKEKQALFLDRYGRKSFSPRKVEH